MVGHSKQRIVADNQFLKIQTQSLARNRIMSETESITQQRDANTVRLRQLRLEKEAFDRETARTAPVTKRKKAAT